MGRSEPGGEKERELARMATMVIAAGRREGRHANDWRTFNEKIIKQAKTGLFIQNLCDTEHPGDHDSREFLSLNPEEIWGICTRWPQCHISWDSRGIFCPPQCWFLRVGMSEAKKSTLGGNIGTKQGVPTQCNEDCVLREIQRC